jgi:hypothetical protein
MCTQMPVISKLGFDRALFVGPRCSTTESKYWQFFSSSQKMLTCGFLNFTFYDGLLYKSHLSDQVSENSICDNGITIGNRQTFL